MRYGYDSTSSFGLCPTTNPFTKALETDLRPWKTVITVQKAKNMAVHYPAGLLH